VTISIDWENKIINVPRLDMVLLQSTPSEIRQLDINSFRLVLRDLEDSIEGMVYQETHTHNPPVDIGSISIARVVSIINDYTITFEDGQYAVEVTNGNSNIGESVNVNQVSVRTNNSGGLVYSPEINKQSFTDARVWIDIDLGTNGTDFPLGTPSDPVDNAVDGKIINDTQLKGVGRYHLRGNLTLPNGEDFSFSDWDSNSPASTTLNLNGVDVDKSNFDEIKITGQCNGRISCLSSDLDNITNWDGSASECALVSNITVDSSATELQSFIDCYSSIPGTGTPILDINGAVCDVQIRQYFGGIEIRNFNQGNNMSIDMSSGHVVLDSTCTSGTIVVRGCCQLTDNSNGATVVTLGRIIPQGLTKKQFITLS
jgi:hypothetical protein